MTIKLPLERKKRHTKWEKRLLKMVYDLESTGHPVRFVTERVLHDYGGMNYAAAKRMHFPWPKGFSKRGYLISATSSPKVQSKDLGHEHREYTEMTENGKSYWPAHMEALEYEKTITCRGLTDG